jgi:hypothetical protein
MPQNNMSPFNGNYYDSSGVLRNIDGGDGAELENMTPFNGNFIGSDGNIHNIDELSGGGGGGTTNYNNLTNKPKINGVELLGDKTVGDLGAVANILPADLPPPANKPLLVFNGGLIENAELKGNATVTGAYDSVVLLPPITASSLGAEFNITNQFTREQISNVKSLVISGLSNYVDFVYSSSTHNGAWLNASDREGYDCYLRDGFDDYDFVYDGWFKFYFDFETPRVLCVIAVENASMTLSRFRIPVISFANIEQFLDNKTVSDMDTLGVEEARAQGYKTLAYLANLDGTFVTWVGMDIPSTPPSVSRYIHNQSAPSQTWTITHNLGFKYVSVQVIDDIENTAVPSVSYSDNNALVLVFSEPKRGTAIIRT